MLRLQSRPLRVVALATTGLLIYACGRSPTGNETAADVSAKVAQFAAAVTGQDAKMANEAEAGRFLGFDTHTYPGDEKMKAWKNAPNAPYSWVGFYLPAAPCHKSTSWGGKRQTLIDMGWGLAVVYVGQQTWNRRLRELTPAQLEAQNRRGVTCNADFVARDRGVEDGQDAIRKTEAEGFPRGTVIFLDIERMDQMPQRIRDYYTAWTETLL